MTGTRSRAWRRPSTAAPALQGLRGRSEARAHCCHQTRVPQALGRGAHDRSPQKRAPDGRNHLAGRAGDAANAVLAAVGYNFGLLLRWLALLLRIVLAVLAASSHSNRTIAASYSQLLH